MTLRIEPKTTDTLQRLSKARHACKDLIAAFETPSHIESMIRVDLVLGTPTEGKDRTWEASS